MAKIPEWHSEMVVFTVWQGDMACTVRLEYSQVSVQQFKAMVSQRANPEFAIYRIIIQSPRQVVCLPPLLRLPTGLPTTAVLPPIFSCRNAR